MHARNLTQTHPTKGEVVTAAAQLVAPGGIHLRSRESQPGGVIAECPVPSVVWRGPVPSVTVVGVTLDATQRDKKRR